MTSIWPLAADTTWLFVRMWPLRSMTNPDPVADPSLPPSTLIVTTLGRAVAAMLATLPAGRAVAPTPGAGRVEPLVRETRSPSSCPATPPTTAESRQSPTTAATRTPRRGRLAVVVTGPGPASVAPPSAGAIGTVTGEPVGAAQ